ncbi:MAG: DEAD/DEAH box helicase, partial [Lacunisphaera sp.]|nr:DEAD/DEAH box helicase [Lacunisphaera sp.]
RELWPAQRLLGEQGIFRGGSAVVQMPTSAGKTRATEILIRSAFLSGRAKVVVIVAPFRALCHEIRASLLMALRGEEIRVDEISDVPQKDFDWEEAAQEPRVLIVTPEKLLYLLRQQPELAQLIGLLVYDEGHQFDAGQRGVTYELLLTSLKKVVPAGCQVVLVSAVISNAAAINDWLNGEGGRIVTGTDLLPTLRSVAFASWVDELGELHFSAQADSGRHRFYVPRVLESLELRRFKGEKKRRFFPERTDGQSIALFLGLKLVAQGSVAIFCGVKLSVRTACDALAEAYRRGLDLPPPREVSDRAEVAKLAALVRRHLGDDGPLPECADLGVFTHHGSTPTGIRLAVEHAMKDSLIKFVICTSTLAQGVNLPLRYLLVTGVYQGRERIKVRDFQNLIGRTGRSGMHTEGSVIFADPATYDQRRFDSGEWRWNQVCELLDPLNSEECASHLLTLFNPISNGDKSDSEEFSVTRFLRRYLREDGGLPAVLAWWERKLRGRDFEPVVVAAQIQARAKVVDALQSFMMAASSDELVSLDAPAAAELARGTLAYHLAKPAHQAELEVLFQTIAADVVAKIPSATVRRAYARNLFGIRDSIAIHVWVTEQTEVLEAVETDRGLLLALWPILVRGITNSTFLKCNRPDLLPEFGCRWLEEHTPAALLQFLKDENVRIGLGQQPFKPSFDHVVDICENALGYEGVLILAAVIESLRMNGRGEHPLTDRLLHLQKRLKYGLATPTAITLHELGFADRVLASDLARILIAETSSKSRVRKLLRFRRDEVEALLNAFPSYFSFVWNVVLHGRRAL